LAVGDEPEDIRREFERLHVWGRPMASWSRAEAPGQVAILVA
jgi:hypothetical protein